MKVFALILGLFISNSPAHAENIDLSMYPVREMECISRAGKLGFGVQGMSLVFKTSVDRKKRIVVLTQICTTCQFEPILLSVTQLPDEEKVKKFSFGQYEMMLPLEATAVDLEFPGLLLEPRMSPKQLTCQLF